MTPAPHPSRPARVFFSYSHRDEGLRRELDTHISSLLRQGLVEKWDDRQLEPGADWAGEIDEKLRDADIVLLLISPDFINSRYCVEIEMQVAMQRHAAGDATVVPVVLRPCDWQDVPVGDGPARKTLGELQSLPIDALPVTSWQNRDEAFLNVIRGLKKLITRTPVQSQPPPPPPPRPARLPPILPYLCDRSHQESVLSSALKGWRTGGMAARPFVCVVHGEEDEELDRFKERLHGFTLPRLLAARGRDAEEPLYQPSLGSLEDFFIDLPHSAEVSEPFELLQDKVGWAVADSIDADKETVADSISRQFRTPLLFHSYMTSEDWGPGREALLRAYFNFWGSLPNVRAGRVLAFLFLKYRLGATADADAPKPGGLFNSLFSRFSLGRGAGVGVERHAELNARAEAALAALGLGPAGSPYQNAYGVVLPKLPPVPQQDAAAWFRTADHFKNLCRDHPLSYCDVARAVGEVRRLYNGPPAVAALPMEKLAPKLQEIAESNCCRAPV